MSIRINNQQSDTQRSAGPTSEIRATSHEPRATRHGFSLTEVLLAVGILAVGMMFIASAFPVSIYFTTMATERTIAPVVADGAFATIQLYGINLVNLSTKTNPLGISAVPQVLVDCQLTSYDSTLPENEYSYPAGGEIYHKPYYWSAVYRLVDANDVQVTLFVSRKTGWNQNYWTRDCNTPATIYNSSYRPVAFPLAVTSVPGISDEIAISPDTVDVKPFVNGGCTILDGFSGRIQRVLQRQMPPNDNVLRLDSDWQGGSPGLIWVVPPPVGGGRYPCVGVYQKIIHF